MQTCGSDGLRQLIALEELIGLGLLSGIADQIDKLVDETQDRKFLFRNVGDLERDQYVRKGFRWGFPPSGIGALEAKRFWLSPHHAIEYRKKYGSVFGGDFLITISVPTKYMGNLIKIAPFDNGWPGAYVWWHELDKFNNIQKPVSITPVSKFGFD